MQSPQPPTTEVGGTAGVPKAALDQDLVLATSGDLLSFTQKGVTL